MTKQVNAAAVEHGLSEKQMHAIHGDLMAPTVDPSPLGVEMSNFDLVTICMALHHLEDPTKLVKALIDRLKVRGVLLVIDRATSPEKYQEQLKRAKFGNSDLGSDNTPYAHQHQHHHYHDHGPGRYPAAHTVGHDSFTREEVEEAFEKAGCDEVDFVLYPGRSEVPMATGGSMQLFFARCRKTGKSKFGLGR